jgi:nicotinate-nucleotide adenylyltransferase
MKIGYFGGTFDPIHRGHLAVAKAAANRCGLDQVWFVPTDVPPHKPRQPVAGFIHRYAMVSLAVAESKDPRFVPSLLESPKHLRPRYSIDTIRRLKRRLGNRARVFFILGIDAFAEIGTWRQAEALLRECDFVVVSRPGFSLANVVQALPAGLQKHAPAHLPRASKLALQGVTIHLVNTVHVPISATKLRAALGAHHRAAKLQKLVPRSVADYIWKLKLYGAR